MEGTPLPVRTRIFATSLELMPFVAVPMLANGSIVSIIGMGLLLATGTGWALTGRWDIGCVVAFFRVAILVLAAIPAMAIAFQNIDCYPQCDRSNDMLAFLLIAVPFALTTSASAFLVARQSRRPNEGA